MTFTEKSRLSDLALELQSIAPDLRLQVTRTEVGSDNLCIRMSHFDDFHTDFFIVGNLWYFKHSIPNSELEETEIAVEDDNSKIIVVVLFSYLLLWQRLHYQASPTQNSETLSELIAQIWTERNFDIPNLTADKAFQYIIDASIGMHGEDSDEKSFAGAVAKQLGYGR